MIKKKDCALCLRIPPKKVYEVIQRLNLPNKLKVRNEISFWIKKAHKKDPTFFCGKRFSRIVGGLIYTLYFKYFSYFDIDRPTQREVAEACNCNPVTIRLGRLNWIRLFPELKKYNLENSGREYY